VKDFRDFLGPGLESCKTLVGYKDVLAHLDGTEEDEIRLRYAEAIAAIFGARLAGIFTNGLPDIASYGSPPGAMASMELQQQLREDGEATHRTLRLHVRSAAAITLAFYLAVPITLAMAALGRPDGKRIPPRLRLSSDR
jgi:hypothetical protein